jgi:dolichol-phosphate mannosyltransferase
MSRIIIFVPTFNCAVQIERLIFKISEIPSLRDIPFVVIDNGSVDGTLSSAQRAIHQSSSKNVELRKTTANNNLGGTHKIAFNYALEYNFDFVGILHGDDQAEPKDLASICENLNKGIVKYSLLGSRFSRASRLNGYSIKRRAGNLLLNSLYSLRFRRKLTDLGSGLNIFRVSDIQGLDYMNFGNSITFNYELLIEMIKKKIQFNFYPISWSELDQKSNAHNLTVFKTGLFLLIKSCLPQDSNRKTDVQEYKMVDYFEQ